MPEAEQQQRHGDDLGGRVLVDRGEEHDGAREHREQTEPHHAARICVRAEPRDPDRRDQQRHRERQEPDAGVDRRQPERHRQEQRDDEEHARLDEVLEEERPAGLRRAAVFFRIDGRTSGSSPRPRAGASHSKNSQTTKSPPRISHSVADRPNSSGASGFGRDPSPHARAQHAEDGQRRARRPTARRRPGRSSAARPAARPRSPR